MSKKKDVTCNAKEVIHKFMSKNGHVQASKFVHSSMNFQHTGVVIDSQSHFIEYSVACGSAHG